MTVNRVIPPPQVPFDGDGTWDSRYIKISSATDSDSVALTVDATTLQADVQFAGTGSAETAARSDHNHDTDYADIATEAGLSDHIAATAAHGATGAVVGTTGAQTLASKTLTTPTISSTGFTNAQHAHSGASSGGTIDHTVLTNKGTNTHAQIDTAVTNSVAHIAAVGPHIQPNVTISSAAEQSNGRTTTLGDFIAATNITSGQLPSGTWAGHISISGDMKKAALGNADVALLINGSVQGIRTVVDVGTTYGGFGQTWWVFGISGGTTPTVGVQCRATSGTQYMQNVVIGGFFFRTA